MRFYKARLRVVVVNRVSSSPKGRLSVGFQLCGPRTRLLATTFALLILSINHLLDKTIPSVQRHSGVYSKRLPMVSAQLSITTHVSTATLPPLKTLKKILSGSKMWPVGAPPTHTSLRASNRRAHKSNDATVSTHAHLPLANASSATCSHDGAPSRG